MPEQFDPNQSFYKEAAHISQPVSQEPHGLQSGADRYKPRSLLLQIRGAKGQGRITRIARNKKSGPNRERTPAGSEARRTQPRDQIGLRAKYPGGHPTISTPKMIG